MFVFWSALRCAKRYAVRSTILMISLLLSGCVSVEQKPVQTSRVFLDPAYARMYGPQPEERFPIPAIDIAQVDPKFLRREVAYSGLEEPGSVVVDTANPFLYLVMGKGRALRYGIGVGKEGLAWSGRAQVGRKAVWPDWTPTADMIKREPRRYAAWAHGMPGGLDNPLGARALYLYDKGKDTLYRLHGTTEPWSIGQAVSSGCIRMFNQDIIDLYDRVPVGAPVIVRTRGLPMANYGTGAKPSIQSARANERDLPG